MSTLLDKAIAAVDAEEAIELSRQALRIRSPSG